MFSLDSPMFIIALLAALGGLRLAIFISQRQARAAAPVATPLAPDDASEQEDPGEQHAPVESEAVMPDDEPPVPPQRAKDHGQPFLVEVVDAAIIAVVLVYVLIRPFLLQAFVIPSGSMMPTLQEGDKLMTTKYTYHLREPRRDEVVVFRAPDMAVSLHPPAGRPAPAVDYVKRVIGLPGDRLRIVAGVGVFRNGERLEEGYVSDLPNYDFPLTVNGGMLNVSPEVLSLIEPHVEGNELVVPPGYLFVLGDNRNGSHDSHIWGLLERKRLVGKAEFIFWPVARWGTIH